ncbi:MAG: hypothetical protein F6K22_39230 [Okeania sp. SIO2F4]|nr:hypothetical protein [Okeania sp. SIO2F4]
MPKQKTKYVCRECGQEYAQSYGQCRNCES